MLCSRGQLIFSLLLFPTLIFCMFFPFTGVSSAATLQSVYDAAGAQGIYSKYLELTAGATYTGGLFISETDAVCIKGNGATLDLQTSTIQLQGASLDIDHCVIKNGGVASAGYTQGALNFAGSYGNVTANTIVANTIGIRVYATGPGAVAVVNNIIVHNTITGLLCQLGSEPLVSYNDAWANGTYNFLVDCG